MTVSVAAFGGQYSFTPSSTNPLFAGGTALAPSSVSLASFLAAGEAFQVEYLKAASSLLGTTTNGVGAYGLQFSDASGTRTFILETNGQSVIAVDQLTASAYEALTPDNRQAALSTGALAVPPFAGDFAVQTTAFRTAYLQANGSALGSVSPQPKGLALPQAGGDRIFILNTAGNDVIDVGLLDIKSYFSLPAADRTLARLSGGLTLTPTAFELRTIAPAQQAEYLATFGATIATTSGGTAVQGVFLMDNGRQSGFILSESGTAIDIGALTFSAFNALSDADRDRLLATGVLRIDPSASEFRAASAAEQQRFITLFGTSLGTSIDGTDVRGLLLRDSAGAKAFLSSPAGVIDVASVAPTASAFTALPAATRALIIATGTLPFLPTREEFQSWPQSSQLAYLTANALELGTPSSGTGSVSGLVFRGAGGPGVYILSASGIMIDPATVSFGTYAATSPAANALTDSERMAIVLYRGSIPTPTLAELSGASAAIGLSYLQSAKSRLGLTPSGTPIEGVRLSDGSTSRTFVLSADGARVIDVNALTLADFMSLPAADQQLVNALPEFQTAITASAFRSAATADQIAYLAAFGVVLGTTPTGATVKGLRLPDGAGTATFILSSTGSTVIDVSTLSLATYVGLLLADRQLATASSAFKPKLSEFLALSDLQKGTAIDDAGEDLGTVAPSTSVRGLRFSDTAGTRVFIRSADGLGIIEPNALTLDAYAALSSADRAIVVASGAFTGGATADLFLASSTAAQLQWLADEGQRLGALPDGTVITGLILDGLTGRTAFIRNAAGTGVINVTDLSPLAFLLLGATDRALVAGSNLFRPTLDQFNTLGTVLKADFVRQASTASFTRPDGSKASALTVSAADGDHVIIVNSAGTDVIDTATLTFTSFYGLSSADRSLVLASGGFAPNPTLAEFRAAAPAIQAAHVNLAGYQAGSLADGTAVKAVVLSDGLTRSMYVVNSTGTGVIDVLLINAIGFAALTQADRDRVYATGQFTSLPTAAAIRANPSLLTANAVTLGYTDANVPVRGLVVSDGSAQTLFIVDNNGNVIEPGLMTTAQLDALTATQRDYIRSVESFVPAGLIPPYFRDANARDPSNTTTGELGELVRVRETKELYDDTYLDGDTRKLANNPLMSLATSDTTFLNLFLQAHSIHQLEYIKSKGATITFTDSSVSPSVTYTTKVLNLVVNGETLSYMASTDGTSVINVAKLSLGGIARLNQADQALVSKTDGFTQIASSLGLTADGGGGVERGNLKSLVQTLLNTVTNDAFPSTSTDADVTSARTIFSQELTLILERLDNTTVFSISALQTKLSEISQRIERVRAFTDTLKEVPDKASAFARGLDYDKLKEGLTSFLREEKRIAVNDTRIARLAKLAKLGIPNLDLPSLIVEFQTLYEIDSRARADADTVEVKQQNAMLADYNEYQRVITLTAGGFPAKDDGKTAMEIKDDTLDARVKNMFDARWGTVIHPIEKLTSTKRPVQYTAELAMNFKNFPSNDNEEIDSNFLNLLESVMGVTIPVYSGNALRTGYEFMSSLDAIDAEIDRYADNTGQKNILNYLQFLGTDSALDSEREAVKTALGITGTFGKNQFKDLYNKWNQETGDYGDGSGPRWYFSQFYLRYIEKYQGGSWTTGDTFFPKWVNENYYKNNDDKGDKLTYDELTIKGAFTYKALKRKVDWDNIGTQLSNAITNINQSNQIRQNSISQYQSEATRHFDLVNNTLKRMFDLMQSIGRNTA